MYEHRTTERSWKVLAIIDWCWSQSQLISGSFLLHSFLCWSLENLPVTVWERVVMDTRWNVLYADLASVEGLTVTTVISCSTGSDRSLRILFHNAFVCAVFFFSHSRTGMFLKGSFWKRSFTIWYFKLEGRNLEKQCFIFPGKCGHNMISKEESWTESAFYVTLSIQTGLQPKNI